MSNIFLTSLGTSWAIIPELLLWMDRSQFDFYENHPAASKLRLQAQEAGLGPVDELWVITTLGTDLTKLEEWIQLWKPCLELRSFVVSAEDLGTPEELRCFRELVFQVTGQARKKSEDAKFWISLAGGRKTMSADMQAAANFFGCDGRLHVLDRSHREQARLPTDAKDFLKKWSTFQIERILPVIIEQALPRNPMSDELQKLISSLPTLSASKAGSPVLDQYEKIMRDSAQLFANYHDELLDGRASTNFLALYSLPERVLNQLRGISIGCSKDKSAIQRELTWLKCLPKPELHCHLGGILSVEEMIEVARVHQAEIEHNKSLQDWLQAEWRPLIRQNCWEDLNKKLGEQKNRWRCLREPSSLNIRQPLGVCAFLLEFREKPAALEKLVYEDLTEDSFLSLGIERYEAIGNLQGSGLLQSEQTIRAATKILLAKAKLHNVIYLEIRCSPLNYTKGDLSAHQVVKTIEQACEEFPEISTRLVFIGSRHGEQNILQEHVQLATQMHQAGRSKLVAFDLAGNEEKRNPSEIREDFLPLLEQCIQITIHAGETAQAESIWQAVYHLQADRIGHGLKLGDHPELLRRFIDRRIAVEMCPSSNQQIVGFQDFMLPNTAHLPSYPLKEYLQQGLKVCVNTDNPGISRTDFSQELHQAARLSPGGLSPWDVLQLLRNGFTAGFCEREERKRVLRKAEQEIMQILQSDTWRALI